MQNNNNNNNNCNNCNNNSKEVSVKSHFDLDDSVSYLEYLRAYQLFDILGKYKLF